MTPKQFYKSKTLNRVREVSEKAGTKLSNFRQIVKGGSAGKTLAEKLAEASNYEMSELEILYPERFDEPESNAA